MGNLFYGRRLRNFLVISAVLIFVFSIAIPRLSQFYLSNQNYQFVGIEEFSGRDRNKAQVLTFASENQTRTFNISDSTTQSVYVNGVKRLVQISQNAVILDGSPLVVGSTDQKLILVNDVEGYVSYSPEDITFQDMIATAPIQSASKSNYSARRAPSSGLEFREIDFRAFSAPDFSLNKSDDEILSAILKNVYLANQYLKALNFVLVLRELKVIRSDEGFSQAIVARDPYKLLEKTADQHNAELKDSIDVSGTFSNTFFPKASGLAYSKTSCVNPHYSVLFVTQGGTTLSQELTLASTLAHEVGHVLGMGHDSNAYPDLGISLMTPATTVFPFGFSNQSIDEQKLFSASDKQGGGCFSVKGSNADSDKDGVSDIIEDDFGTDKNDPGSFPASQLSKAFTSWNGFKGQTSVGEILAGDLADTNLSINIRNLNGSVLSSRNIGIGRAKELDLIFSDLLPDFTDTYGMVEITANVGTFSGLSNTYSHTGQYGTFNYISKQNFFAGSKFEETIPFNSLTPFSFPQNAEVLNWLSIANLNPNSQDFEIFRFSLEGQVLARDFLNVPGMGRRDVLAGGITGLTTGSVLVRPTNYKDQDILFHSFISRYYAKQANGLTGSVIVDGVIGTDTDRVLLVDNDLILTDKQSNTWMEVSNASRVAGEISLIEIEENSQKILSKSLIKPYQTIHLPLSKDGLRAYRISSTVPYTAIALRYKGERANSTVQRFVPHEYLKGSFSGSLNTFLASNSYLYIVADTSTKETVACNVIVDGTIVEKDISLSGRIINKVSLEGLFPEVRKDSYYKVFCKFKNSPQKAALFMGRTVDSKHTSIEPLE